MRKLILLFSVLFFMMKIAAQDVQKLCDEGNFIAVSHLGIENWESDNFSIPLLKAAVYNAMARFEESNKEIELLLQMNDVKENPQIMINVLTLQADNYVKTFQYEQTADSYKKITDNYGDLLGEGKWSYQNAYRMYAALSTVEPLQVFIPHDTKIQTTIVKENLPQVQVRTPKDSVSLVFDTGAGTSCVSKSVANRLGIKILADSFIVGGPIANTEYMSIGIADTLYLGDILYENVVFGIFEDELGTWSGHDYIINGALGFPEMRALSSIKIHKNGILEIFKNEEAHKSNMMFSRSQQIIVQVNDSLLLVLDTGGNWSNFSINYYNKNKEQIDKTGQFTTKTRIGFGGIKEFSVYKLNDFPIKINTSTTILPEIVVYTERSCASGEYEYDGFLGQDVILQYDYMLLDFKNMCFSLGNEN